MKLYLYLLLSLLLGGSLQAYSQCYNCPEKTKPTQPTALTFSSDGTLISTMPTVITASTASSLTVVVDNNSIAGTTPLQNKILSLTGVTATSLPACLTSTFAACLSAISSSSVTSVSCNSATISSYTSLTRAIQDLREKTYFIITGGISTSITSGTANQGIVSFPRPEKTVFRLKKRDADKTFLKTQFQATQKNKHTTYVGWQEFKPLYTKLNATYLRYSTIINQLISQKSLLTSTTACCGTAIANQSLDDSLCIYLERIKPFQVQLCQIADKVITNNKGWLSSWLWYTGGMLALNPFGQTSPAEDNAKQERDLAAAEEELKLYQALLDKCCESTTVKEMLTTLKPSILQLSQELTRLRKFNTEEAPARQKKYDDWLKSIAQTETVLNEVVLYASDCHQVNWMTHYDAKDDYAKLYSEKLLPELIYEHDALRGLVHNISADKKVLAKEVVKEAKLRTELDVQTDVAFEALAQASSNSAAISQLVNKISTFVKIGNGSPTASRRPQKKPIVKPLCSESELKAKLEQYADASQLISWLNDQKEPPIADLAQAYDDFDKKKATQEPILRSEDVLVNESRNAKGTNDISYDIFETGKDKPVASNSYKTYSTVRFWPSVSINYVFGSRAVSIFDNTTGQFRTDTEIDNFEAVVGVKWYWGPSNVTRTLKRTGFLKNTLGNSYNGERGNCWLGKTFLTGGLGVSHKFLKNYFLGAGVDIVPGFSVQAGGNLFFRKAYDLNNGQINREYDIPSMRLFFGLAIDPNVVTKLLSIF